MLLRGASVESLTDGVLTLGFAHEGNVKGFMASGHDQVLSLVLERMLGITLKIRAVAAAPGSSAAGSRRGPARAGSGGYEGTGRGSFCGRRVLRPGP